MKKLEKAEIRKKSVAELNEELLALKEELFKLRFAHATNQLENPQKLVQRSSRHRLREDYSART